MYDVAALGFVLFRYAQFGTNLHVLYKKGVLKLWQLKKNAYLCARVLKNECLTYLSIKNESIRNRFHFNSRFV